MVRYTLTIFLSAFLLFAVQPLMGKYILPWFGGGAGIWTACMLFFQCVLLVGYSYAHLISSNLRPGRQMLVHIGALAGSLLLLPITPESSWKSLATENPTQNILILLVFNIGVPFALLSATGPLLSRWFSVSFVGRSPYRLYALSNTGSLLALLSYPFLIEPFLSLGTQAWLWSAGYGLFVLLCAGCAWQFGRLEKPVNAEMALADSKSGEVVDDRVRKSEPPASPGTTDMLLWLALAANASVMLLATTHQVSQDLAVIPLLWVLPLALYLLSFILCFDHDWWYNRWIFGPLLAVAALAVVYVLLKEQFLSVWTQITVYSIALFAACMVCHGELVRIRPDKRYLTRFYLIVGSGGALGGILVAVVAPLVFNDYWEYQLGLVTTGLLAMTCVHRHNRCKQLAARKKAESLALEAKTKKSNNKARKHEKPAPAFDPGIGPRWRVLSLWSAVLLVFLAVVVGLVRDSQMGGEGTVLSSRSFFGVTHIIQHGNDMRLMEHGRTIHGAQFLNPRWRMEPTAYYERDSGIDIALAEYRRLMLPDGVPMRIGVVGLGTGTIAALTRAGDSLRYYEIDPEVERLAREYFTFIEDSDASVEVVLGDARIVLEQEAEQNRYQGFDVLVVDAFNSDAVPIHLLTREAITIYLRHLKPQGLLAFNVTNRYLNLGAVVRGLAQDSDREVVRLYTRGSGLSPFSGEWAVMTDNPLFLTSETIRLVATEWSRKDSPPIQWSDEYASLWRAVMANGKTAERRWDSAPNQGRFLQDGAFLIGEGEARYIRNLGRKLYHDSGGQSSIILVTSPARPVVGGRPVAPRDYLEALYNRYGLNQHQEDRGMLIVVSVADDLAYMKMPRHWPPQMVQRVIEVISTMMNDGVTVDDFSARLVEGIEAIDRLVRERQ
jgi:hypothetical protein